MPTAAKRPCRQPRCTALVDRGYCEKHTKGQRGHSVGQRTYDSKWYRYSVQFRHQLTTGMCGDRLDGYPPTGDSMCQKAGLHRWCGKGTGGVTDHIIPVDHRGQADPGFWDGANHQVLCKHCANAKNGREGNR